MLYSACYFDIIIYKYMPLLWLATHIPTSHCVAYICMCIYLSCYCYLYVQCGEVYKEIVCVLTWVVYAWLWNVRIQGSHEKGRSKTAQLSLLSMNQDLWHAININNNNNTKSIHKSQTLVRLTRARTHARTHAHARTHTHTHTRARTHVHKFWFVCETSLWWI